MSFNLGKSVNKAFKYPLLPLAGFLTGKTQTQEQVPLETPEQAAARKKLMGFADTGTYGDFTAGADIGIGAGADYNATDIENTGLSNLQKLIQSGTAENYKLTDEALKGMLTNDPAAIQAQFDPFKVQTERQIAESNNALKRNAGFAGNLYSTSTIKGLGDVQARGNETLTSKLAELTNSALDRKLQASQVAIQSAQAQEKTQLDRIGASQQYGSLIRNLNNQAVEARDAEILRRRTELQLPLGALQTVAGQNSTFGVPSIQYNQPSALMPLLQIAATVGGKAAGAMSGNPAAVAG